MTKLKHYHFTEKKQSGTLLELIEKSDFNKPYISRSCFSEISLTLVQSLSSHHMSDQHILSSLSGRLHPGQTSSPTPSQPKENEGPEYEN